MNGEALFSNIVAISGHREFVNRGELFKGLDALRAAEYVFGGARGVDSEALEYLSRRQPLSFKTVIVPNTVAAQPAEARAAIAAHADVVIELGNTGRDRYEIRNRAMIDRATHLRAFYDFRGRGGTYNAIEYARRVGKSFDVWAMQSLDLGGSPAWDIRAIERFATELRGLNVPLVNAKGMVFGLLARAGVSPSRTLVEIFRRW